jgi:hypothetical protein
LPNYGKLGIGDLASVSGHVISSGELPENNLRQIA